MLGPYESNTGRKPKPFMENCAKKVFFFNLLLLHDDGYSFLYPIVHSLILEKADFHNNIETALNWNLSNV